jgi:hypothetical protein
MTSTAVATKIVGKAVYLELVPNPILTPEQRRQLCGYYGDKGTKQIVIFPQYQNDSGRIQYPVVMTRIVSENSPRAQWDTLYTRGVTKLPVEDEQETIGYKSDYISMETYSAVELAELSEVDKKLASERTFDLILRNQLIGETREEIDGVRTDVVLQGWVVRDDTPLAVEITNEDMEILHVESKTPQAVIRRINKIRESVASFPTKLV